MNICGIESKNISITKLIVIESLIAVCFLSIFVFCKNISIKNAPIAFYETTKNWDYKAVIATKGISIILKELYRSGLYSIYIPTQSILNKNDKLNNGLINGTNGIYIRIINNKTTIENTSFQHKEILGNIDYTASLTIKGAMCIVALYIFIGFLYYFGIRQFLICIYSYTIAICNSFNMCVLELYKCFIRCSNIINNMNSNIAYLLLLISIIYLLFFIIFPLIDSIVIEKGMIYDDFNDSGDMQWYPSVQYWGLQGFSQTINPYNEALGGNIFLANIPNYMHLLYIIMYPFALFEFDTAKVLWAIFNNICIIMVFYYIYLYMKTTNIMLLFFILFSLIFFCSYNYRFSIFRGNMPLVLCFFTLLAYIYRHNTAILTICLSILFIKYTFGIPISLAFLLCRYYKAFTFACIIHLISICIFAYQFDLNIVESILLPSKMITSGTFIGPTMDILNHIRRSDGYVKYILIFILLTCLLSWIYVLLKYKPKHYLSIISAIFISFCMFQHIPYDYTMLSVVFALFVSKVNVSSNCRSNRPHILLHILFICIMYILLNNFKLILGNITSYLICFLCYIYAISIIVFPKFTDFNNGLKHVKGDNAR